MAKIPQKESILCDIPVKVHLSMTRSNQEPHEFYTLTMEDQVSGQIITRATLSVEEVGRMISGQSVPGKMDLFNAGGDIGKKRETESHRAYIPYVYQGTLNDKKCWGDFQDLVQLDLDNRGHWWKIIRGEFNAKKMGLNEVGPYYTFTIERYI